ncbi:hypothetical protein EVAR_61382_1 [Eumeta japonica]|uniref:Uncharacterized protein n=1 Tax=Eumeta variegata TaxID=151549 RepID=A0A4C1Z8H9_EUMVA|nr:hypothetical protein EVAR_61382_1 [Eumeta japonica]
MRRSSDDCYAMQSRGILHVFVMTFSERTNLPMHFFAVLKQANESAGQRRVGGHRRPWTLATMEDRRVATSREGIGYMMKGGVDKCRRLDHRKSHLPDDITALAVNFNAALL